MRLVFFGTGSPLAVAALERLAGRFRVAAVVTARPAGLRRRLAARLSSRPLRRLAAARGLPVLEFLPGGEARLRRAIDRLRPDLLCVATFPSLLPPDLLATAPHGAIGLHPSLLPRHRGPSPLFWTYFAGDAETGVTVFRLDAGEDTGDLIGQQSLPVARGRPAAELYAEMAAAGARLLEEAIDSISRGTAVGIPQEAAAATREPSPARAPWAIDFETWSGERVWHFLHGLAPTGGSLLRDPDGRRLSHGPPLRFLREAHERPPGSLERSGRGLRVYCRDGIVELGPAPRLPRAAALARLLRLRRS
jgi:methionyl-tRNA formyltransferase